MSITDHFQHIPDAGFVRTYDGGAARRQFRVSMVLIAVIALAAAAITFVVRFEAPVQGASTIDATVPPAYAGKL